MDGAFKKKIKNKKKLKDSKNGTLKFVFLICYFILQALFKLLILVALTKQAFKRR